MYDPAGRLIQTQETPTGEYCKTRVYAYDEESDRVSLMTREPNSSKECATEGGETAWHHYDTANRMTDVGIAYETLGNVTELPAADAGGAKRTPNTTSIARSRNKNRVARQSNTG